MRTSTLAASGALLALITTAMALKPEALLTRSFETALGERPAVGAAAAVDRADREGLWLSRHEPDAAAGLIQPVALGDRISLRGSDGRMIELVVVDVRPLTGDPLRARTMAGPRIEIVTARTTGDGAQRTIRFIVETDEAEPMPTAPKPQRAL